MELNWTEIFSLLMIINGSYIIAYKHDMGVGWEGFEPSFYLKRRGCVVVGIFSVLLGLSLFVSAKMGYPLFEK